MPLFCRHNRHTSDCPICSEEQGLTAPAPSPSPRPRTAKKPRAKSTGGAPVFQGPFASVGPYEDGGESYEVRLERVPGGIRLAEWGLGKLRKRAPVLAVSDLAGLVEAAAQEGALEAEEADAIRNALESEAGDASAISPGRSGELRDELRVESLDGGRVRIGRWLHRGTLGWELQQSPVMLPARRYAEALRGVSGAAAPERQS